MKSIIVIVAVFLFFFTVQPGYSQDFQFELYTRIVEEGQIIIFNLTVLNPSLTNVEVDPSFISPDGIEVEFVLPPPSPQGRGRWLSPMIPPATGRVNLSETGELDDLGGETMFEWRTPFNGKIGKTVLDEDENGNWTAKIVVTAVDFARNKTVKETFQDYFNVTKVMSEKRPKYVVFGLSIITSMFTTIATYFMVDQKKARAIKEKVSAMQKEIMEAQRSGDKKRIAKAKRKQSEMMSLQSEMMRNQFKPMIIYMIPLFAVFYFLRSQYDMIPVTELPFKLGFMQFFHQNNPISADQFGFIAWYFASATWFGSIFRKILGVT